MQSNAYLENNIKYSWDTLLKAQNGNPIVDSVMMMIAIANSNKPTSPNAPLSIYVIART